MPGPLDARLRPGMTVGVLRSHRQRVHLRGYLIDQDRRDQQAIEKRTPASAASSAPGMRNSRRGCSTSRSKRDAKAGKLDKLAEEARANHKAAAARSVSPSFSATSRTRTSSRFTMPCPHTVQRLADKSFALLKRDPRHPSLHLSASATTLVGAGVSIHYRALAIEGETAFSGSGSGRTPTMMT